jgi:hypothetical protein
MHSGRLERAGDDFVLEEDGVPKEPSHLNKNRQCIYRHSNELGILDG